MQNRERLVRSAAELFHSQGYAATSVEDLLGDTGIVRSNFYYHFDSKLDLAREILEQWAEEYHRALDEVWEEAGSPEERLRVMFELMGGEGEAARGLLHCPLGALGLELAPHDPDIQDVLRGFFERLERRFDEVLSIEGDRPEGGEEPSVPMAALVGALMMCHAFRGCGALDAVASRLPRLARSAGLEPGRAGGARSGAGSGESSGGGGRSDVPSPLQQGA